MPSTSSDRRRPASRWHGLAPTLALTLALAGCRFTAAPARARPALPLPTVAAVEAPQLLEWNELGEGRSRGVLAAGVERVRFQLRRQGDGPRPLVLLVPILAGGEDLMDQVANRLQDRGFDTAFCARVGAALKTQASRKESGT